MGIAAFTIVMFAQALMPAPIYAEQILPQEAADRASRCGLGTVSVSDEPELQTKVLIPAVKSPATDEQLLCLDQSTLYYPVQLMPDEQVRFDALRLARYEAALDKYAQVWVTERGMPDPVPSYERGIANERVFTREVEKLCGPRARGGFQSRFEPGTLSPAWLGREIQKRDFDGVLECLMNISRVAGFGLGFVGNEANTGSK